MAGNYLGVLPMMTSCQLQVIFARNMLSFTVIQVSKETMLLHTRYSNMWFCIQTKTLFQDILDNLRPKPGWILMMQEIMGFWDWVQIAVATLSGNSLRQTVHTRCASVHKAAKLVAG